jgi:hypothetical protein
MIELLMVFVVGGIFGAGFMCCCILAGRADTIIEDDTNKDKADIS